MLDKKKCRLYGLGELFTELFARVEGLLVILNVAIHENADLVIGLVSEALDPGLQPLLHYPCAVFGSYGYDGAWIMEERLKARIERLGYQTYDEVCVLVDTDVKYNEKSLDACKKFGKDFAESI